MTMTTEQMIEVLQAYQRGEKVQFQDDLGNWHDTDKPCWNFEWGQYRIAMKEE